VAPVAPVAPVEPVAPVAPVAPVEPVAPVAPVAPVEPVAPDPDVSPPLGPVCQFDPVEKMNIDSPSTERTIDDIPSIFWPGAAATVTIFVAPSGALMQVLQLGI